MTDSPDPPARTSTRRIVAIDLARAAALLAMAVYHFTWDREFFGYLEPGTASVGGWKLFARCIASTFLFLAGFSLYLAHGQGIRWRGFWRRSAVVAGAAVLISAATWWFTPGAFIFFGILHEIALASLLGLAFLRLPAAATLVAAALVVAAPHVLRSELFDHPAWWWLGLSPVNPRSNDYVPLFPWFGAVLAGIAAARLSETWGLTARLAALRFGRWSRLPAFLGRHSLAVYLIHQPVLIGALWVFAQVVPPATQPPETRFLRSCERSCEESRGAEFCARYCGCMLDALGEQELLEPLLSGSEDAALADGVETLAAECTMYTDARMLEEEDAE